MVEVKTQILIDRPIEKVAEYASNPDNTPLWYENINTVQWKTQKPITPGSQIAFNAQFLGRQLAYTYEIAEFIPGKKLVMQTANGPFPMQTTYEWESVNQNTTRMILINKGIPAGFSKIIAPFMSMAMKMANKKDLKRLKNLLESSK